MSDINLIISATDNASKSLNQINNKLGAVEKQASKMSGMGKAMGRAFIGAAAAFATIGVVSKVKDTIDNMDDLAKRARNVGVTSELAFGQFQVASKLLEEGGLSAGEADRAFRNLNTRITKGLNGNKAYAEAMKGLGDSIFDASGNLKSTPELFAAVATAVQNGSMDIEDAQKLLGEVVGPKIFNLFDDMKKRGVSASDAFKDVAENIALVDLKKAQDAEAFNDALGRLGEGFNQLLIDGIGPLLPKMTEFVNGVLENMPAIVEKGRSVLDTLSPVFALIGTILTDAVLPMFESFIAILGKVATAVTPLAEAAIPMIVEVFDKLRERTVQVVDAIVPLAEKTLPYLKDGFDLLFAAGQAVSNWMIEMANKYGPAIGAAFIAIGEKAAELYNTYMPPLMEIFSAVGSKIAELYETYGPGLIEAFTTIGSKAAELYGQYLKFLFDTLVTIATKVYELAQDAFPYLVTAFDSIKSAVNKVIEVMGPFISKTIENLKAAVIVVSEKFNQLITFLKEIYEVVVPAIETAFNKVVEVIGNIQAKIEAFTKTFTDMKDKVVNVAGNIKEGVGNAMDGMADGATKAAKNAYDGVTGMFDNMADYLYLNSVVPDMRDAIIASFDELATGMIAAAETGTSGVSKEFDELENELTRKIKNINQFAANMTGLGFDMTGFTVDQADEFIGQMNDVAFSISDMRKQAKFGKVALSGLTGSFKAGNINLKEYINALEYAGVETDNLTSRTARTAYTIAEQFGAMSSTISSTMTDVIMGTKSGFEALGDITNQIIKMIVNTLVQNFIVSPLIRNIQSAIMGIGGGGGGGGGGFLGGLLGGGSILGMGMSTFLPGFGLLAGIGGILGGLFADGGNTARAGQKPILVGERGPEIFLPGKAGTVVANEDLNSMGDQGDLNVSFTINAIDTQTGVQFLLENKRVITGVIQEAYMRRGTSGPLG